MRFKSFGIIIEFCDNITIKNIKMKKTLLLLGIGLFLTTIGFTQDDGGKGDKLVEKLRVMYGEEKYQDCAHDAIKYASMPKHKNNAELYIYASMACLRISQYNEGVEEFKKSYADALTYAGKYRKKDRGGLYYPEYLSHFEELKKIVAEEVENYMLEERKAKVYKTAKKSLGLVNKIHKMDPNDKGAYLMAAVLEMHVKNTIEGKAMLKIIIPEIRNIVATADDYVEPEKLDPKAAAKKKAKIEAVFGGVLNPIKPFDEMTEMEQVFLRLALIEYTEYLYQKKKYDEAKDIIEIGKPYFYKENDDYLRKYTVAYKAMYDKVNK